jgi:hypothetical protein
MQHRETHAGATKCHKGAMQLDKISKRQNCFLQSRTKNAHLLSGKRATLSR